MDTALSILLWGGLLFVMMRFGCGSHMFGHQHENKNKGLASAKKSAGCCESEKNDPNTVSLNSDDLPWSPPEEDIDPVCGKTVSTANAKSCERGGLVYYFCSSECRETFESAPDDYLGEKKRRHLE